ncbi:MAG: metal-dependent hydrolase [Gemmatimonadaceae bacterium]|nr:metal-dependent hydrolase [Gemmatimonadaceae bacterium]
MDPITHTLAGAAMARVGADRTTPLATATLMLAANAPDVDMVTVWTTTGYGSIAFRRGWTHGPLALLLLPLILTALVWLWDVAVRRRRAPDAPPLRLGWILALAYIGTLSHPMLDWLNTYGIRLLMPFSDRWFYGDAVFIIDPYWWLLLASVVVLARRKASLRAVRVAGIVALAYPLALVALARVGDRLAMQAAAEQGIEGAYEVLYQPRPARPFAAQLIAVTDSAYHFGRLQWLPRPSVHYDGAVIAVGDLTHPRVVQARDEDQDVRDFLVWSRYPYVEMHTTAADGSTTVVLGDARFPRGGFAGALGGLAVSVR